MEIKSDYELMNVVSTGLAKLSNQALNGAIEPYKGFEDGSESITVKLTLGPVGQLSVEAINVEVQEAEIKALKKTVKEQTTTITSLTPETETTPKWAPKDATVEEEAPIPKSKRTSK